MFDFILAAKLMPNPGLWEQLQLSLRSTPNYIYAKNGLITHSIDELPAFNKILEIYRFEI